MGYGLLSLGFKEVLILRTEGWKYDQWEKSRNRHAGWPETKGPLGQVLGDKEGDLWLLKGHFVT